MSYHQPNSASDRHHSAPNAMLYCEVPAVWKEIGTGTVNSRPRAAQPGVGNVPAAGDRRDPPPPVE